MSTSNVKRASSRHSGPWEVAAIFETGGRCEEMDAWDGRYQEEPEPQ